VLHGAEEACRKQGIVLSSIAVRPADGLIDQIPLHAPTALSAPASSSLRCWAPCATGKPLVLIDMQLRGYSSVNPDNMMGGYLATNT
jgi:DNA-binding LacI/PurR family transcriptional regulator